MTRQLNILTLNANGLRTERKRRLLAAWLQLLRPQILFLQETHTTSQGDLTYLKSSLGGTELFWSHGTNDSCGTCIMIMPSFLGKTCSFRTDDDGRLVSLDVSLQNRRIRLINLYAPNKYTQRSHLFRSLERYLEGPFEELIIGGDFNCVLDEALDRQSTGRVYPDPSARLLTYMTANLELIDAWRSLNGERFDYTWESRGVRSRLDRFYVPSDWRYNKLKCEIVDIGSRTDYISDHRAVTLQIELTEGFAHGTGLWRLNATLLDNTNFSDIMEKLLISEAKRFDTERPDISWAQLKENLRVAMRAESKKLIHAERKRCCRLRMTIGAFRRSDPMTEFTVNAINELQETLNSVVTKAYRHAAEKIEGIRISGEETFSSHFYQRIKTKQRRPAMLQLEVDGRLIEDQEDIRHQVHKFYQRLYDSSPTDRVIATKLLSNLTKVQISDPEAFTQELSLAEIKNAIESMSPNKAPGSDGLPVAVYLKYWEIIGPLLGATLQYCLDRKELEKSMQEGTICLIPKDPLDIKNLGSWRPITLLNTDRKILAKVLDTRLAEHLTKAIDPSQTGGVRRRNIHSNLIFLRDVLLHCWDRGTAGYLISLDQIKAFDLVSHEFLFGTLRAMGLPQAYVSMIQTLYKGGTSKVLVNGHLTNKLDIKQGVRQGCPLSPALFATVAEVLATQLRRATNINRIYLPIKSKVLIFQHSDDSNIIVPDADSVVAVFHVIDEYCRASGAGLNMVKTKILRIGYGHHDHLPVSVPPITNGPIKILGTWFDQKGPSGRNEIDIGINLDQACRNPIYEGFSMQAKAQIIRTKLLPAITYHLPLLQASTLNINKWERLLFTFLWSGKQETIARTTLALPKSRGGLNLVDMALLFKALNHRRISSLLTLKGHPMMELTAYLLSTTFKTTFDFTLQENAPRRQDIAKQYIDFVNFAKKLKALLKPQQELVKLTAATAITMCLSARISRVEKAHPQINWSFSWTQSQARYIEGNRRDLTFKLIHDALPLRSALRTRGMTNDSSCPFCDSEETAIHTFYQCVTPTMLRNHLAVFFGLRFVSSNTVIYHQPIPVKPELFYVFNLILSEMKFQIWKTRNRKLFDNKFDSATCVRERVRTYIRARAQIDLLRLTELDYDLKWCNPALAIVNKLPNGLELLY